MVGSRPLAARSAPAWGSEPPHPAWNILIPSEDNSGMIQSDDGAVVDDHAHVVPPRAEKRAEQNDP